MIPRLPNRVCQGSSPAPRSGTCRGLLLLDPGRLGGAGPTNHKAEARGPTHCQKGQWNDRRERPILLKLDER